MGRAGSRTSRPRCCSAPSRPSRRLAAQLAAQRAAQRAVQLAGYAQARRNEPAADPAEEAKNDVAVEDIIAGAMLHVGCSFLAAGRSELAVVHTEVVRGYANR